MQHDAQEEEQHARHQDHRAYAGPRGALPSTSHRASNSPLALSSIHPHPLQPHSQAQRLLLGHGHHGHALLLAARQEATSQLPGQAERPLLGDGQGQHVAAVAGEADEDRRVLRGMRDGDDSDDVWVVWELGDGQARRELGDATAPGTANLFLAAAHLGQTHRAARVPAIQEFRPPARAVVVKADLALQYGILGKSLHVLKTDPLLYSLADNRKVKKKKQPNRSSRKVDQLPSDGRKALLAPQLHSDVTALWCQHGPSATEEKRQHR